MNNDWDNKSGVNELKEQDEQALTIYPISYKSQVFM